MIPFFGQRHIDDDDLSAFVDEALAPGRRSKVAAHVARCETCRSSVAELRSLSAILRAVPAEATPRSFTLDAHQAGLDRRYVLRPNVPRLALAPAALAMVALIALVIVDVITLPGGSQPGGNLTAASRAEKSTADAVAATGAAGAANVAPTPPVAAFSAPQQTPIPRLALPQAPSTGGQTPQAATAPGAPPAATGAQSGGIAPGPTAASAAESALPPATGDTFQAQIVTPQPAPGQPPVPSAATAPAGGRDDAARPTILPPPRFAEDETSPDEHGALQSRAEDDDRTLLRIGEGLAALVLLVSLGFIFWRARRSVV